MALFLTQTGLFLAIGVAGGCLTWLRVLANPDPDDWVNVKSGSTLHFDICHFRRFGHCLAQLCFFCPFINRVVCHLLFYFWITRCYIISEEDNLIVENVSGRCWRSLLLRIKILLFCEVLPLFIVLPSSARNLFLFPAQSRPQRNTKNTSQGWFPFQK